MKKQTTHWSADQKRYNATTLQRYNAPPRTPDLSIRTFLILLAMIFLQNTSTAQNEIPSYCACLTFVYACTGQPATALYGGTVIITCVYEDGNWDSRDYSLSSSGAVTICNTGGIFNCPEGDPILCISEDNWEVCSIDGCTVYVDQTLTRDPHINGKLLGYGPFAPYGSNILCEGRHYEGPLNNIHGATDLYFCPDEELILELEDFDIPTNSGMCLYVNIYESDWDLLDQDVFDHSDVTNGTVDVTALFETLETNEIYIIAMRLKCCEGDGCFDTNAYRYAYINFKGKFGYQPTILGTAPIIYVPSTTAPGPIIPTALGNPPFANVITFFGNNVVNLSSVDEIDYALWEVDCSGETETELASGTITPDPGNTEIEDAFTTGTMGWPYTTSACKCFRIDLTYYDVCSEDEVTDSYFFRSGGDCLTSPPDPSADKLVEDTNNGRLVINVSVNPIRDATLVLDLAGELPEGADSEAFISIFDAAGHALTSQPLSFEGRQASVPFDAPPGIYFYSVRLGDQTFAGKFVKQ